MRRNACNAFHTERRFVQKCTGVSTQERRFVQVRAGKTFHTICAWFEFGINDVGNAYDAFRVIRFIYHQDIRQYLRP